MDQALTYILKNIVDHPDEVVVEVQKDENARTILVIHVNTEDIGKIIGKQGRIIHAIRDVIKLIAAKHNEYVDVTIHEDAPVVDTTTPTTV